VTLRCLHEDPRLEMLPVEVDLGSIDHPLVAEARRIAPAAPRGQKRTWLEADEGRFWLCAAAQREVSSRVDAFEVLCAARSGQASPR
jgi:hypothetical protein